MFAEAEYSCGRAKFGAGDFMVIYSDGISEAYNVKGDMLGEGGLCQIVEIFRGRFVENFATAIQSGVRSFQRRRSSVG